MIWHYSSNTPEVGQVMSSYSKGFFKLLSPDGVFFVSRKEWDNGAFLYWNSPHIHFNADYDRYRSYFLVMVTTISDIAVSFLRLHVIVGHEYRHSQYSLYVILFSKALFI